MLIQWCCLLLLSHFPSAKPRECDSDTQYQWPMENTKTCCSKCHSGQYMSGRCSENHETRCSTCGTGYYTDEYNTELSCKMCVWCDKENMVYKLNCTTKSNAVCGCEKGYECNNENCEHCVKLPPPPPTIAVATAVRSTAKSKESPTLFQDSVWVSLSLCCACVCILLTCFILISRHTPACGRTMSGSADCFFRNAKRSLAESSQCTEEEEVPMPVQEVCGGKTEWQDEV